MISRKSKMIDRPAYIEDFIQMVVDAIEQCEDDPKQKCTLHVADDNSKRIVEDMINSMDLSPSVIDRIFVEKVTVH
tara:strand:+ start:6329 stop:6556 length:228 start_codon:yes stop_codon:yes gene_type:complete